MTALAYAAAASGVHFVRTSFPLTSRGNLWKRMDARSRVAFVGGAAVRLEVEPGPIKTHTLKHDKDDEVLPLLTAYGKALDSVLDEMEDRDLEGGRDQGRKPVRPFPRYKKDDEFEKSLRNKYLEGWSFAAHWVDSALVTAFSIMESWRKNYNKGNGNRK